MAATGEDITVLRNIVRDTYTSLKQVHTEAKMSLERQTSHNEDLLVNTNYSITSIVIEIAIFSCVLAFQVHLIKKSLDNKLLM